MAKIALTKLNSKPISEVKIILWNDCEIEVKQYLPIEEKLDLISNIINESLDNNPYPNLARMKIFLKVELILSYTNINTTEKQKENIFKLYDMFAGELGNMILSEIPEEEKSFIYLITEMTIDNIYKYKNSAMGIMETIASDYSDLNFDATEIQKKIGDPSNLELLKDVLSKLG